MSGAVQYSRRIGSADNRDGRKTQQGYRHGRAYQDRFGSEKSQGVSTHVALCSHRETKPAVDYGSRYTPWQNANDHAQGSRTLESTPKSKYEKVIKNIAQVCNLCYTECNKRITGDSASTPHPVAQKE